MNPKASAVPSTAGLRAMSIRGHTYTINDTEVAGAATVYSFVDEQPVAPSGSVDVTDEPGQFGFVFIDDASGRQVAVDYVLKGHKETLGFSAHASAVASVLLSPALTGWSNNEKQQLLNRIPQHPLFDQVVQSFQIARGLDDSAATGAMIDQLALEVGDAYAQALGTDLPAYRQAISAHQFSSQTAAPKGTLSAQAVTCNFNRLTTWMSVRQDGSKVTVSNNGLLAVDLYLVPNDVVPTSVDDVIRHSLGQPVTSGLPNSYTPIGFANQLIAGFTGERQAAMNLPAAGTVPRGYRVIPVVAGPKPGGVNFGARDYNNMNMLGQLMGVLGLNVDFVGAFNNPKTATAALALNQAFNTLIASDGFAAAARNGDYKLMAAALAGLVSSNAQTIAVMVYQDQVGNLGNYDKVSRASKKLAESAMKGVVSRAATALNLTSALGSIATYAKASIAEASGSFPSAVVTDQPDADTYNPGCEPTPGGDGPGEGEPGSGGPGGGSGGNQPAPLPLPNPHPHPGPLPAPEPLPFPQPVPDPSQDGAESTAGGDPHYNNYDGALFDFQGTGEFILTKSTIPGDGFEVQVRQLSQERGIPVTLTATPVDPWYTTGNMAVALRVGRDRVTFTNEASRGGATGHDDVVVRVNGQVTQLSGDRAFPLPSGGYISTEQFDSSSIHTVVWSDGSAARISTLEFKFGTIEVFTPAFRKGRLVGLMGNYDGFHSNDVQLRDGSRLPNEPTAAEFYGVFGESWRVRPDETLFDYLPGQSTNTFTNRIYPSQEVRPYMFDPEARAQATTACEGNFGATSVPSKTLSAQLVWAGRFAPAVLEDCVVDVLMTGNVEMAVTAALASERTNTVSLEVPRALPDLAPHASVPLTALVAGGLPSREVEWTVTGGTVTRVSSTVSKYTAPAEPGTYTLTATLASYPWIQQSTTVTVTAAPSATRPHAVITPHGTRGKDGWYVSDVSFSTAGSTDAVSCTTPAALTVDSSAFTASTTCTNAHGETDTATVTVKRDATAPVFTGQLPASLVASSPNGTALSVHGLTAGDPMSGLTRPFTPASCTPATLPLGRSTVSCQAEDEAGNVQTLTSTVQVTLSGVWSGPYNLLPPLRNDPRNLTTVKLGSTVPVKFAAPRYAGGQVASDLLPCLNGRLTGPTTVLMDVNGTPAWRYDPADQQYIYTLSTKMGFRAGTYELSVTCQGLLLAKGGFTVRP